MLVTEKYELVAAALMHARASNDETLSALSAAQFAALPATKFDTTNRRTRQLDLLDSSFAEMAGSKYAFHQSFAEVVNHVVKGDGKDADADRAFFNQFMADVKFRDKFFKAMDDLAAANDNAFSHDLITVIKDSLKKADVICEPAIRSVVQKLDMSKYNMPHDECVRGLIDLLQETNGTKLTRNQFAAAVADQVAATEAKNAAFFARQASQRSLVAA